MHWGLISGGSRRLGHRGTPGRPTPVKDTIVQLASAPHQTRRLAPRFGMPQSKRSTSLLLQSPSVLLLLVVTIFPVAYSLALSFQSYSMILPGHTGQWVGADNYVRILSDADFLNAAQVTIIFIVVGVAVETVLGILLAVALDSIKTGRRIFTSLLLVPMILTPLVIGLMYNFLFNAQFGLLTYLIQVLGIPLPQGLLGNPATAFPVLIFTDIWEWTPFMCLAVLAGMQALPSEPLDAARVDGASYWQALRYVTLPMVRPILAVALLFRAAEAIKEFDKVYILTGGGPGNASEVVDLFTYRVSFGNWDMSYGAALGMVLFVVSMVAGGLFFLLLTGRRGAS
jgi:multiple sugar transport system permease protein